MNDYGFIDYRQPAANENDYRTSTYRANIHLVEQISPKNAGDLKNVCTLFPREGMEDEVIKSECQRQYTWKVNIYKAKC